MENVPEQPSVKRRTRNSPTVDISKQKYYLIVLDDSAKKDFKLAAEMDGIDAEIALLRTLIKKVVENTPNDFKMLVRLTNSLSKLVKINAGLSKSKRKNLTESIGQVIKDIAVPLGVAVISKD
jgi:hypothetical protein